MKQRKSQKNLEGGITLISLIMTIIIMVILAALILRTVAGDNNLIGVTQEASENYKVAQYKEELIAEVMGVIQSSMIKGEDVTQEKIAEAIKKDLDWVKEVKVNEDKTITSPDIIVISKEGYIFQVTYDDTYGSIKVDYIGKDPSGNGGADEALKYIPNVTGRYDKVNTKVIGEASVAKGSIQKLEIIFKGNVLTPDEGSNLSNISKTITEGGIYEIKATTDRGITRSAYVRVNSLSGELEPPEIKETNGIHGDENWYREGLEVTISSSDETVTEVHYLLKDASDYETGEEITMPEAGNEESEGWVTAKGREVVIPITTLGRTRITAYVTDGKNKSEANTATVKYDNVLPTATLSDPGTSWHKNDVEISISGEDQNSGINGYKYYLNDSESGTHEKDIEKPIVISTEGTTKVKVQTVDKAGNTSSTQERTIKLDKTGPVFSTTEIEKTNIRPTSFKVYARATDSLSGIAKYICYVTENGNDVAHPENGTGDFEITGLKPNTRYDIRITAIDNAGNESEIPCIGYVRTTGELKAPNLSVTPLTEGTTMTGGYYKCGVRITVSDSTSADETTAVSLHYEVVDASNESLSKASGQVTNYVNFSQEGTFKVRAWAKDEEGTDGPKTEWQSFGIDTAAPTIPSISLAGTAGTNSWYKSNITVTITAGNDVTSKVRGVQYYTEKGSTGGQAITGSIDGKYLEIAVTDGQTTGSTSITITTDGITKIHARTVDNAGNVSGEAAVREAKKDATNPPTVTLTYKEKTGNTVTATTSMTTTADATSGIAKYIFEYQKGSTGTWTTALDTATRPSEYKFTGLEANTSYNFRVRTMDNAGNTGTGTAISQTTDSANDPMNPSIDTTYGGLEVNYTPKANQAYNTQGLASTTSTSGKDEYSGYGFQYFQTSDLPSGWQVWGTDDNYIYIISTNTTTRKLYLQGELGYNNGVTLLDNICDTCFTDKATYPGSAAQNLKLEQVLAVKSSSYTNANGTYDTAPYTYGTSYAFPYTWYQYENSKNNSQNNRSKAYALTTQTTNSSANKQPYSTYWYNSSMNTSSAWVNSNYHSMVLKPARISVIGFLPALSSLARAVFADSACRVCI